MAALLEIDQMSKTYGALLAVDALTLSVEEGEALAIIGPNGAGKSTMFNLVTGDVRPNGGHVHFQGSDITGLAPHLRSRLGIGRSYQIPHPFTNMSVYENLLVGANFGGRMAEQDAYQYCAEVLHITGLSDKANVMARSLTLLQRKRLELARALATRPKLLLLDEIAGGLTEHECNALVETIRAIHAGGTTIIWIEHVLHALTSVVECLLVLDFGKVIGHGDPEEIMASKEVQKIYLGIEV